MLHLLQPNIPNRNRFLLQLLIVSVLFHVVIGIVLLHVHTDQQLYKIVFNNNPIDLVDMIVSPCAPAPAQSGVSSIVQQPVTKSVTHVAPIAQQPKKEPIAQPVLKKMATNVSPVTPVEKKAVVSTPKKEIEKKNPVKQTHSISSINSQQKIVTQKEYDALALQQLVQEELQQYWQPPSGLSNDLWCEMSIELDAHGAIKQFDCVRSSGVLMYDIHAQSVLMQVHYPKETWGKHLTITFKQA